MYEGVAGALVTKIKEGLMATPVSKIGALLSKKSLKRVYPDGAKGNVPL